MTGKTAAKVAFKMVKTLMISGVIIAICIVVMQVNQALGIILMMLYSSFMVIKSSRKEMPLNKFTALLPGVMALISFLVMFALLGVENPILPLIGCGAGVVFGLLMAKGHRVYKKNGVLYSKRTFFYISIWTLSLLFTQGSTLAGMRKVTDFGLLLNGFTSLGVIVLSIFLFKKANTNTPGSNGGVTTFLSVLVPFVLSLIIFTFCFNPKQISNNIEPLSPSHTGEKILNTSPQYYAETSSLNAKLNLFTPALIFVSTRPISSFDVIQASNLGVVLNMPRQILEEILSSLSFIFILQSLFDNLAFTIDGATTAGALITLIQLFMGLGMSAAMTAAQEAANDVMTTGVDDFLPDRDLDGSVLLDPANGEPLIIQDGSYEGGEPGQVWYEGQWLDKDEAVQQITVRQQEIDRENEENEKYLNDFQKQNEKQWEQKMADRDQRLHEECNIYDKDQDAWIRDPSIKEPRSPIEEYYSRGDYVQSHLSDLTKEQREAAERILERTGYNAPSFNADGSYNTEHNDVKNQQDLTKLSNAINKILTGKHQSEMAEAEHDEITLKHGEKVAEKMADAGEMAASYLENKYLPTKGAISGFVFETLQSADKGAKTALYNGFVSASSNVIGDRLGNCKEGNVLWNSFVGGLTNAAETGAKGGNADDMIRSGGTGFVLGGLFEHLKNVDAKGGSHFDFDNPNSRASVDTDIQSGTRGTAPEENIVTRGDTISDQPDSHIHTDKIEGGDIPSHGQAGPTEDMIGSIRGTAPEENIVTRGDTISEQPDSHIRTDNIERGDIPSHGQAGTTEDDMIKGIKESVANNKALQRAEAAAERLRRGEDFGLDERELSSKGEHWVEWDNANTGSSEPEMPADVKYSAIKRTAKMQDIVDSGDYSGIDRIDTEIREAWRQARFGPDTKNFESNFRAELESRNVSKDDYDRWEKICILDSPRTDVETIARTAGSGNSGNPAGDTVASGDNVEVRGKYTQADTFKPKKNTDV